MTTVQSRFSFLTTHKLVVFVFVFAILPSSFSRADSRIGPGQRIYLDVSKADKTAISHLTGTCLHQEILYSLLPNHATLPPAPRTTPTLITSADTVDERVDVGSTWTVKSRWMPSFGFTKEFVEQVTVNGSIEDVIRSIDLQSETIENYIDPEISEMQTTIRTDAGGDDVDVDLNLSAALPYIETFEEGGEQCSVNNWGREDCKETFTMKTAELVIPAGFVPTAYWTNSMTTQPTRKMFDFYKYAECLLESWEKPR